MTIGATAWTTTNPLPRTLLGVASVRLDNLFFILGKCGGVVFGHIITIVFIAGGWDYNEDDGDNARAEIFAFDGEHWKEVGQLQKADHYLAATKIDITDLLDFCN